VHEASLTRRVIVVPDEMKETMDEQQVQLDGQCHADALGLAKRRVGRDDHLAEEPRWARAVQIEGQHISRASLAKIALVQAPDLVVADHRDVEVSCLSSQA